MLQSVEVNERQGKDKYNCSIIERDVYVNGKLAPKVDKGNSPTGGHPGATKSVYFSDDYVVKFGDLGEAYLEIQEQDRKHFAEVVYVDINREWYVQKRVNCVPNTKVTNAQVEFIQELADKYDFNDVGFSDGRRYGAVGIIIGHNFTIDLNGIPVIYDYTGF